MTMIFFDGMSESDLRHRNNQTIHPITGELVRGRESVGAHILRELLKVGWEDRPVGIAVRAALAKKEAETNT